MPRKLQPTWGPPKPRIRRGSRKTPGRKRGDPSRAPKFVAEHQELVDAIRAVWHEWDGERATEAQHLMVREWVDRRVREGLGLDPGLEAVR